MNNDSSKGNRKNDHEDDPFSSFLREAPSFYLYGESNPNPILITNSKGEIQYVNAAWERLTGHTYANVIGMSPHFLNSSKTAPDLYKTLWKTLVEGKSFESEKFIDQKKDGTEFSIHTVFFPIRIHGKITYFAQIMHDISEQKRIEKQKDAFISEAAHELRAPLSVIVSSLELLKHELGTAPDTVMNIIKTLQGETGRFTALLNDLLDVSKIKSIGLHIQKEERDMGQLLHRVVDELRMIYTTHTLIIEEDDTRVSVMCDEERIAQVITNLISNAVKYSPQSNKVVIRLEKHAHAVVVCVQDFGIGIAKEEQEKIFDIFYRAKSRSRIPGTGLGLFLTAEIITAHKGRLWVTSKPDKGSVFHFSLPLQKNTH